MTTVAQPGADAPGSTPQIADEAPRMLRDASRPMYQQLCDQLIREITSLHLAPGHRLPGEHGMCERYGVSRTVVRQALGRLEQDGVIERVKGKGTFVASRTVPESLVHTLRGLYADVESRGGQVRSDVRRQELAPADDLVAQALQVQPGETVLTLERLRYVDGSPWSLTTTYLPARLAPVVLDADLTNQSLYALLAEADIRADHGVRSVEAVLATKEQGEALNVQQGAPLMLLRSVIHDARDSPIEFFVAYHRGDQSRFEFKIDAATSPSLQPGFRRVTAGQPEPDGETVSNSRGAR